MAYVANLSCALPLLFLEAQELYIAAQNIFPSIRKARRNNKYKKENFMIFITL